MRSFLGVLFISIALSCQESTDTVISVTNTLEVDRSNETVTVKLSDLGYAEDEGFYEVQEMKSGEVLVSQLVDDDDDGSVDAIIFQPEIAAGSEQSFKIRKTDEAPQFTESCYSRFVPERTDDYAWENNKVAFRTYGPTAQKMVEDGVKGGTLSSGIDAWLKRVEYPIINKWYKKELETDGSYHEDTGEGLDNFHVGVSRGIGGIAIKNNGQYHISRNFTVYETHCTGPLRTSFTLDYADWSAGEKMISESKRITLDHGSNLSKFEISIVGADTVAVGLTLHDNKGITEVAENLKWASYWEDLQDSEIGTGIVANAFASEKYETEDKDLSNLFLHLKSHEGKVVFYAGFGWKKSGQFENQIEWNAYLDQFSKCLNSPLLVTIQ